MDFRVSYQQTNKQTKKARCDRSITVDTSARTLVLEMNFLCRMLFVITQVCECIDEDVQFITLIFDGAGGQAAWIGR